MERSQLSSTLNVRKISSNPHGDVVLNRWYLGGHHRVLTLTGAERENLRQWLNLHAPEELT